MAKVVNTKNRRRPTKKIVTPTKTQSLVFVLDYSGSMTSISSNLIKAYKTQLQSARESSKNLDIKTRVSVYVFGDIIKTLHKNVDINSKILDSISFKSLGMTALYDAVGTAYEGYKEDTSFFSNGFDDSLLLISITDGYENASKNYPEYKFISLVKESNKLDNTTLVFICPPSSVSTLARVGVPQDNISAWDGSAVDLKVQEEKTSGAILQYYNARSMGQNKTACFYQPDVNFSPTTLKRNVTDVTHQFLIAGVTQSWDGKQIRDFVENELVRGYVKGNAYYQLTKKETVQANKNIVIRDLATGKMYSDDDARDLLGLPSGQEIKVIPASYNGKYELFVESQSVNRKLVAGTKILYKIA